MSAATDTRNASGLGAGSKYHELFGAYNGPIAANVNLPHGTLASFLVTNTATSPVIYPFAIGAGKIGAGFVEVGGDNTGGIQGAFPIRVVQKVGKLVDANSGGASAITAVDAGKVAYGVDNQTCSKISTDGEPIGMIIGVDADGAPMVGVGPMFLALARAYAGQTVASGIPVTFPVILSQVASGVPIARINPGVLCYIDRLEEVVISPATTTSKLASFAPLISAVAISGGVLATTSTSLATVGTRASATTITGSNKVLPGQEITIVPSSVTTYIEGQILLMLFLKNIP